MGDGGKMAELHGHMVACESVEAGMSAQGANDMARLRGQANGLVGEEGEQFTEQRISLIGMSAAPFPDDDTLRCRKECIEGDGVGVVICKMGQRSLGKRVL